MKRLRLIYILLSILSFTACTSNSEHLSNTNSPSTASPSTLDENHSIVVDTTVSTAKEALTFLKEGNTRFTNNTSELINISSAKRSELTTGQSPYAIVISCSDSRVTPSHVFNAGLGELFEIRIAGNVLDDNALGSIEYGAEHLASPLIVVMGHESCGAVTAAYEAITTNSTAPSHIDSLVDAIEPSITETNMSSVEDASHQNVANMVTIIKEDEIIKELLTEGKLQVVGAYYTLDGKVTFLDS